jgi:hypothetical protein
MMWRLKDKCKRCCVFCRSPVECQNAKIHTTSKCKHHYFSYPNQPKHHFFP